MNMFVHGKFYEHNADCMQPACRLHAGCMRSYAGCIRSYVACEPGFAAHVKIRPVYCCFVGKSNSEHHCEIVCTSLNCTGATVRDDSTFSGRFVTESDARPGCVSAPYQHILRPLSSCACCRLDDATYLTGADDAVNWMSL